MSFIATATRYRFGDFELDQAGHCLRRNGMRIKLQPKPFLILLALMEQPGVLLTREELQKRVWPADIVVDFDHGLNVAIKKLRDALCDSSDAPRYIETIPGRGYRWVAQVQVIVNGTSNGTAPVGEAGISGEAQLLVPIEECEPEPAVPPLPHPQIIAAATPSLPSASRRAWPTWMAALSLALLIGLALAALFGFKRAPRGGQPLRTSRGWVLVVPFENYTGEAALDGVEYLVARNISDSQFFNVVPPERIGDALRLMRRPPDTRLDFALAREVAARDGGIEALIKGRVQKVGTTYVVQAWVISAADDSVRASAMGDAADEKALVPAARVMTDKLRSGLGEFEALAMSQPPSARLEKVTTPSLRSLQFYTAARDRIRTGDNQGAAALLQEALRLDPEFASGHVLLAQALSNAGRGEEAAPHYVRALELSNTATERERYFILGSYYERYAQDQERARRAYEALLQLYPDEYGTYNNLIQIHVSQGLEQRAAELAARAADLRPRDLESNAWAMERCANAGNRTLAQAYAIRAGGLITPETLRQSPGETLSVEFFPIEQLIVSGDNQAALSALQQQEVRYGALAAAARVEITVLLARQFIFLGRLHQSEAWIARLPASIEREFFEWVIAEARNDHKAMKEALIRQLTSPGGIGWNSIVRLATLGMLREANTQLTKLSTDLARPKTGHAPYQLAAGSIALAEHRPAKAISWLEKAEEGFRYHNVNQRPVAELMLARAYEAAGHPEEAIQLLAGAEADHYSNTRNMLFVAEARLHLWQLYVASGQKNEADAIEAKLRSQLSVADPDHPILQALAAGYASRSVSTSANHIAESRNPSDRPRSP